MSDRRCSVPDCTRRHQARGWCITHYGRWMRQGDPAISLNAIPWEDRFYESWTIDAETGCWLWTGQINHAGYGRFAMPRSQPGQRERLAHRMTWEMAVGPVPEGLQLDHLCRRRSCVNPDHLEPVTSAENTRRGVLARQLERI
jgi:hypothetical protein